MSNSNKKTKLYLFESPKFSNGILSLKVNRFPVPEQQACASTASPELEVAEGSEAPEEKAQAIKHRRRNSI